jgi:hypothetical protein
MMARYFREPGWLDDTAGINAVKIGGEEAKMPETFVPEMTSRESREALAAAVTATLDRWGLPLTKQAALLGLPDVTSIRDGRPLPEEFDVLARAGHLLAIDRALQKIYGTNAVQRDVWLMYSYPELGGQSPLALMLTGLEGIKSVRKFLETRLKKSKAE